MDPESSSTTTDPRSHVTAESVEQLPAGLFMDEDGNAEAGNPATDGDTPAVGLDTEETASEADAEAAEADAGEEEGAAEAEADEGEDGLSEAPEFWSAEDKAAWASVPPALRPLLHKLDKQRVAFEQEKAREAAQARKEAGEQVQQATSTIDQAAKWWQANGPQFFKTFGDRWAGVDWNKLADENPAEWTRLNQLRASEAEMLRQADEQGRRDIAAATKQAETQLQEARRTEHEKLATKLPEFFGSTKAAATYDELGKFLFAKGIPATRINAIYEAPIIELALNAMRFEQAQKKASAVVPSRDTATGQFTARTAPTKRVQPGPALNRDAGDRNAEAARRAGERFRKGGGASMEDAAAFAKVSNLFG